MSKFGEWLPIETAPKDGTAVLITTLGIAMLVRIGCYVPPQFRRRDEPMDDDWWATQEQEIDQYRRCGMRPTHFMPLPEPPQ